MRPTETGTLPGSSIFFCTPSALFRRALFYPQAIGEFLCDETYHLTRADYDSILLLLVEEGTLRLKAGGESIAVTAGEICILDCLGPHEYYAEPAVRTLWVHFNGASAREWCAGIISDRGRKMSAGSAVRDSLRRILSLALEAETSVNRNEAELSSEVCRLICTLSAPEKRDGESEKEEVSRARAFMEQNFGRTLTVEEIAASVSMSASHFSRIFREATGFSPYECLQNIRLEEAKLLLRKTKLPVSEVAYRCGFNSDANFICFFKKKTDVSPLRFRNLRF